MTKRSLSLLVLLVISLLTFIKTRFILVGLAKEQAKSKYKLFLFDNFFILVLSYCYNNSHVKHSIQSIFSEESSEVEADVEQASESHRSLFSNAARLLERLKSSPSKSRLKQRRP